MISGMNLPTIALFAAARLVLIDPGHFHAALSQKRANPGLSPEVSVFAPRGRELDDYLELVASFNGRAASPTCWREDVYAGEDFLEKFRHAAEGWGGHSVVVLAGRNDRKGDYALAAVESGCHVLSDKPMAITPAVFERTRSAALLAKERGLCFADMMTARHSFRARLQARLARCRAFYGDQEKGTPDDPSVVMESVHHFYKRVDGRPLRRPAWYYDTAKQGEGIVDVATHMVDRVQWSLFPGLRLSAADVVMVAAKEWPTVITPEQYELSTGERVNAPFDCLCNGSFTYSLRGVHCRVSVVWNFQATAGAGDTGHSLLRGTKAEVFTRQGPAEGYRPVLYARPRRADDAGFEAALRSALASLSAETPGLACERAGDEGLWRITYPERYEVSHEEQFALVLEDFLRQVGGGRPDADGIDNLIVKYHTLVEAWKTAHGGDAAACALPELLKTEAGQAVATAADWENVRRPEIKRILEREEYGVRPVERPSDLSFETVVDNPDGLGGLATLRRARITWKGPYGAQSIVATAFIPKTASPAAPAPAFVFIAGRGGTINTRRLSTDGQVGAFDRDERWPAEEMVRRGYAMVAYDCTDVAEDDDSEFKADVFRCFTRPEDRIGESWATISAWAWGASRVLDWVETVKSIDAAHVGVVGLSRRGKAALWAGATDTRFAMSCSAGSGCCGAKLFRHEERGAETIRRILRFRHWFCRNFDRYAGRDAQMPFDHHQMLALVAPRLLCVASGSEDSGAGPQGEYRAAFEASPAWELYGKRGLVSNGFPKPGEARQDGCVSYHLRKGGHDLVAEDWRRFADFAERHGWLKGK